MLHRSFLKIKVFIVLIASATLLSCNEAPEISGTEGKVLSNDLGAIEASAVVEVDGSFWVISDETEDNKPNIYVTNQDGEITSVKTISGLSEMLDMEAAAKDENDNIYITSSLSSSSKGKVKSARKLLIKVSSTFALVEKVDLYDKFQNSGIPFLEAAINDSTIDIEGLAYKDSALYFGLKSPFQNSSSVIIKVVNIFENSSTIEMFKSVNLGGGIISLEFKDELLYIVSKASEDKSLLWQYSLTDETLMYVRDLEQKRVEGLTFGLEKIVLTKDGNDENSAIYFLESFDE